MISKEAPKVKDDKNIKNVIAVMSGKGGVGKTTTSINLAASLAHLKKKVLLIDTDPQANATSGVGVDKAAIEQSIYNILVDEVNINDVILKTAYVTKPKYTQMYKDHQVKGFDIAPLKAEMTKLLKGK